jgi:superfamily I DNA and/or RNA helicase
VAAHTLADLIDASDEAARVLDVVDTAGTGHEESTPDGSDSKHNEGEAGVVERIVRELISAGLAPRDVGVITPYSAQAALLGKNLAALMDEGLEVDSVDGFQGREKEAIVFSAVRSNSNAEVGFLADRRRLNVAITRAKRRLTIVGDSATLSSDERWRALFDHAIANASYRSAFELPESEQE